MRNKLLKLNNKGQVLINTLLIVLILSLALTTFTYFSYAQTKNYKDFTLSDDPLSQISNNNIYNKLVSIPLSGVVDFNDAKNGILKVDIENSGVYKEKYLPLRVNTDSIKGYIVYLKILDKNDPFFNDGINYINIEDLINNYAIVGTNQGDGTIILNDINDKLFEIEGYHLKAGLLFNKTIGEGFLIHPNSKILAYDDKNLHYFEYIGSGTNASKNSLNDSKYFKELNYE